MPQNKKVPLWQNLLDSAQKEYNQKQYPPLVESHPVNSAQIQARVCYFSSNVKHIVNHLKLFL